MRKYRNSAKVGESKIKEVNRLPSMTVPDQSLDVRTILEKYASGTLPDLSRELVYSEDMPDLRGLDISELHDMKVEAKNDVKRLDEEIKSRKKVVDPSPTPVENVESEKTEQ